MELDNTGYGKDMESTRDALEFHMGGIKEISDYRVNVERCGANKVLRLTNILTLISLWYAFGKSDFIVKPFST